ncbi:hypothetical protein AVEN_45592-1 [Araneus ventricosus]|uniref:Uncharacterized protein n=1 Tax=Araneus ventricosus TaxID=182803 RepID=A0A4Y2I421_ARAVE|nr:hypothetical protein AVEN_45592-1 [Araneus ventricosus]
MTRTTPELEHPSPNFRSWWSGSLPAGPLLALHPFWVGRASVGIFAPYQREDVWPPTYDLTCNRPNTRRILTVHIDTAHDINWVSNPPAQKPRTYH